jgi:K+-transporting ATPase ATPase C chain
MLINLRRSIVMAVIAMVFFGFIYAFAGVGVSQLFFKSQADGSITANGSTLIGQNWSDMVCPGHPLGSCVFQGRPDDLGPYAANPKKDISGGDNPLVACQSSPGKKPVCTNGESAATNLGPRSKVLLENTKELLAYWHARSVDPTPDLVTTSGSGYDPDITPADALAEIPMVAKATGIAPATLDKLIAKETHGEELGFLGSQYIDVLQLNEALAKLR